MERRDAPGALEQPRTVIVFGVTGAPRAAGEVEEIAAVMGEASKSFPALRLVMVGRGSTEVRKEMEAALAQSGVEIVVRGVVPAETWPTNSRERTRCSSCAARSRCSAGARLQALRAGCRSSDIAWAEAATRSTSRESSGRRGATSRP